MPGTDHDHRPRDARGRPRARPPRRGGGPRLPLPDHGGRPRRRVRPRRSPARARDLAVHRLGLERPHRPSGGAARAVRHRAAGVDVTRRAQPGRPPRHRQRGRRSRDRPRRLALSRRRSRPSGAARRGSGRRRGRARDELQRRRLRVTGPQPDRNALACLSASVTAAATRYVCVQYAVRTRYARSADRPVSPYAPS